MSRPFARFRFGVEVAADGSWVPVPSTSMEVAFHSVADHRVDFAWHGILEQIGVANEVLDSLHHAVFAAMVANSLTAPARWASKEGG